MGFAEDTVARLDAVKAQIEAVDSTVEALYEQLKSGTLTDDQKKAVSDKITEIEAAVAKVASDDDPVVPTP